MAKPPAKGDQWVASHPGPCLLVAAILGFGIPFAVGGTRMIGWKLLSGVLFTAAAGFGIWRTRRAVNRSD